MRHGFTSEKRADAVGPQSGFSVVELVIAVAVFTIVMGSIYGLLEVGRRGRTNTLQRNEVLQNARIALNYIGRDAINAGVSYPNAGCLLPDDTLTRLGLVALADSDVEFDVMTPVFASDGINVVNGVATDEVTFAYLDDGFMGGSGLPITRVDIGSSTAILTVGNTFSNSAVTVGDTYMVTGINGYFLATVTGVNGTDQVALDGQDSLNINDTDVSPLRNVLGVAGSCGDCAATASLTRVRWVTYRLTPDGDTSGILVRHVYGGRNPAGAPVAGSDQPLAFGVDNLQVTYVLRDGRVVDSPVRTDVTDEMTAIRQVRVTIDVSSPEVDPRTNRPFRSTLVTTFSTRNLEYERQ